MIDAPRANPMKPKFPVEASIYIRIANIKCAHQCLLIKGPLSPGSKCRYANILGISGVLLFCLCGVSSATEIAIKVVGDSIFVAADSRGIQASDVFDTCKILQVGDGTFFSFAGARGLPIYDIRQEAAASVGGTITETDTNFRDRITDKMTAYARANGLIGTPIFTDVAFYAIEKGKAIVAARRFSYPLIASAIISEREGCPPDCRSVVQLGEDPEFSKKASEYVKANAASIAHELECVVRAATIRHTGVGGEISIARIDSRGLTWIKRGACKNGPQEQRWDATPDPKPCQEFMVPRN